MVFDYDALLMQANNLQLTDRERHYARLINYANQTTRYAHFLLAFFLAFALDKQIAAWHPNSIQDQAFIGFCLALASFGLFYLLNLCFKCWAGDPFDQFGFESNEQQQQQLEAIASSIPRPKQAVIGGLAIPHESASASAPLFASPLASVNTVPPRSPLLAQWLVRQQQQQQLAKAHSRPREESISPDVLKFNPFMKSMMHRT